MNSIPYVLSEMFPILTMGTWVILIFSLYILVQFLILGRNVQPLRLLQLLGTVIFGYFTDFTNWLTVRILPDPALLVPAGRRDLRCPTGPSDCQYGAHCPGHYLLSDPKLIALPSEGIMEVISEKTGRPFHGVKVAFDVTVSAIALALSLLWFREFHGIREGTVIAAVGVGVIIGWLTPVKRRLLAFLFGEATAAPVEELSLS